MDDTAEESVSLGASKVTTEHFVSVTVSSVTADHAYATTSADPAPSLPAAEEVDRQVEAGRRVDQPVPNQRQERMKAEISRLKKELAKEKNKVRDLRKQVLPKSVFAPSLTSLTLLLSRINAARQPIINVFRHFHYI